MKTIIITFILSLFVFTSDAFTGKEEIARIHFDSQTTLEFRAMNILATTREQASGLCVYEGQLWQYAMSNPPRKILVGGCLTIDKQKVKLDVTGLALPWIHPQELTLRDCKLTKYNFGEADKDYYYKLDVAFIKSGALDYMVTWIIYKNKSLRIKIEDLDDIRPSWLLENETRQNE